MTQGSATFGSACGLCGPTSQVLSGTEAGGYRALPQAACVAKQAAPENIINRDFQATALNEKWLTDITEFQIPAGKVYLSPIIDCFDGMVVSWTIGTSPDAELVNTMLDAAIETVAETTDRPAVHSDRGGHSLARLAGWQG